MSRDVSIVMVIPDAYKDACNEMVAAYFGDDPGAQNLSVPASPTGAEPATHWFNHTYLSFAAAAVVQAMPTNGGTLPEGLNLTGYDVTEEAAKAAAAALSAVSVESPDMPPREHVDEVLGSLDLQEIVPQLPQM